MPGFDPYYKWLGIPQQEQPPHHYRLLGIAIFESDVDVIDAAASRQAAYLQACAMGPHVALSQKLLNEIAAARLCLVSAKRKAAYDDQLRARLMPAAKRTVDYDEPPVVPPPRFLPARNELPTTSGLAVLPRSEPVDAMRTASVAVRVGRKRGKQTRSAPSTSLFIAKIVLGGLAGLVAGGFVIFLVNPKHPLIEELRTLMPPFDNAPRQEPRPRSKQGKSAQLQNYQSVPTPSPKHTPSVDSESPRRDRDQDEQTQPEVSQPPQVPDVDPGAPKHDPPPMPADIRMKVDLDFSRRVTRVPLPNAATGEKAEVRIESVAGLGTPYELKPKHGILRFGQPVNIMLTEFPSVSIQVSSMRSKDDTCVEVTPEVDVGKGKKLPFTEDWIRLARVTLKKKADNAVQQLQDAMNLANNIDAWLNAPGVKPLELRGLKRKQLQILRNQTIPALQQQATFAQTCCDALQKLSQIVENSRGMASIQLVIRTEKE